MSKRLLNEIEMMGLHDPLIIKLQKNKFWIENYKICCSIGTEVDLNLFVIIYEGQKPNSKSYHKIKIIAPKIKYTKVDIV